MRRLAHMAGLLFVILCLGFVAEKIWSSEIWHMGEGVLRRLSLAFLGGGLVYALSGLLLATAWWGLVRRLSKVPLPWSQGIAIYGRSQLAKYLPGNVFHLVGRHAYGQRLGLGHRPQAVAVLLEVALTILAAATLAMLGWSQLTAEKADDYHLVMVAALGAIVLVFIALAAKGRLPRIPYLRGLSVSEEGSTLSWKVFGQAYALYLVFFLVSAAILTVVVLTISGNAWSAYPENTWFMLIPITAVAWLLGFVTPGASAGIGVREAVLIVLLAPLVGDRDATMAALSLRFVTVVGDLGFFLFSFLFRKSSSLPSQSFKCSQEHDG
jgi:uncharacterized membrane protein YbhN (UPF0104 family)